MRLFALLIAGVAVIGCASNAGPKTAGPDDEIAAVKQDVREMSDAMFAGDVDTLMKYTLPAVIEKWGGPEAFKRIMAGVYNVDAMKGIEREALEFPTPPELIQGKDGRLLALAPNRVVIKGKGRGALTGFYIGVKENAAADWKYVPGYFATPQALATLVPDFPLDRPLPPRGMERLSR